LSEEDRQKEATERLKRKYKKERSSAIREIRRDKEYLAEKQFAMQKEKREEHAEKIKEIITVLHDTDAVWKQGTAGTGIGKNANKKKKNNKF